MAIALPFNGQAHPQEKCRIESKILGKGGYIAKDVVVARQCRPDFVIEAIPFEGRIVEQGETLAMTVRNVADGPRWFYASAILERVE